MTRLLCLLLLPAVFAVPAIIRRPCNLNDYECIGKNLAANSVCDPRARGGVSANYTIPSFEFHMPYFNGTSVDTNLTITNHQQCKVSEFFFNLATDNAVLAVKCKGMTFQSIRTLVQHTVESEDTFYNFDYKGTYPEIILTVNLRPANAINLCNATVFAYVSALPDFEVDPNDKQTDDFLSTDLSFMNIFERETFFYRANELLRYFVNSVICDFHCDF